MFDLEIAFYSQQKSIPSSALVIGQFIHSKVFPHFVTTKKSSQLWVESKQFFLRRKYIPNTEFIANNSQF